MSHFTVLVIGDVEKQLAPYDENIEVPEYQRGLVSEEDKERFLNLYTNPQQQSYCVISEEEAAENKKLSFDELYDKYGENWNGNDWRKNDDGEWAEFSTYNPKSKWDWYSLGGRWSGEFFIMKHGAVGGIVGESGVFGNTPGIDSIKLGDVDWEAMRKRGEDNAKEYWEKLEKAFGGVIPIPKVAWADMHKLDEYKDWDIEKKREFYHEQPEIKLQEEVSQKQENRDLFGWGFDLNDFACGKEEYIRKHGESALSTYALVVNGKWYERGEMGWFGISSNEKDEDKWYDEFSTIIAQCDEDEQVSLVDCHI